MIGLEKPETSPPCAKPTSVRLLLFLLLSLPVSAQRWPDSLCPRLQHQPLRAARSLQQVMVSQGQEWQGSSEPWLLDLDDGTRAVFRSEDEPWGSQAEIAGFRFTRWLGLELTPPTVPRLLRQSEWPPLTPWPFPGPTRIGSMQLYVPLGKGPPRLDPDTRADIEVVSFVLGRYDNHEGNLLTDQAGQPCLVDFENSLEIEQVRYGQIPFVRRGGPRPGLPSLEGPFPFDHPSTLVTPTLDEVRDKLGPWWTYWPQGLDTLWEHTQNLEDRTIHYAIWEHRLWVQARARSRHPSFTEHYHPITMERLARLDATTLRPLLPEPYTAEHVQNILDRAHQVLAHWQSAGY